MDENIHWEDCLTKISEKINEGISHKQILEFFSRKFVLPRIIQKLKKHSVLNKYFLKNW